MGRSEDWFPYEGEVIWLSPDQGGLRSVPDVPAGGYPTLAHVPPDTVHDRCATLLLRGWGAGERRAPAEARWLFGDEVPMAVDTIAGTVIALDQGHRMVGLFLVLRVREAVDPRPADPRRA